MAVPTIYYRFLEQPAFREAARTWSKRPALHLRLGPDPRRSAARAGSDPRPAGHQSLRHDARRSSSPACRSTVRGRTARSACRSTASRCGSSPTRIGRRLASASQAGRGRRRAAARAEPVSRILAQAGRHPRGLRDPAGSTPATWACATQRGFLTLVGRKHDLIITSGFNVYPQVVERVINECPGVRESAVLGVPDAAQGRARGRRRGPRRSGAGRRSPAAVLERAAGRLSAARSDIVFVDALPRNAMGKVLRRELREQIQQSP